MICEVLMVHMLATGTLLTTRQPSAENLFSVCSRWFFEWIYCLSSTTSRL